MVALQRQRIFIVTSVAFWELFSSGFSSIALSQNWSVSGAIILSFATSNIVVRVLQIAFWKYRLSNITGNMKVEINDGPGSPAPQKAPVSTAHAVGANEQDTRAAQTSPQALSPESAVATSFSDVKNAAPSSAPVAGNSAAKTNDVEIEQKQTEASEIYNYNFALYFIAFSTFSDASFDIIQAIVLIAGIATTTLPVAVLGSIIGFSTEVLDFLEEMLGFACDLCRENAELSDKLEKAWCISVSIGCIIEQSISMYVGSILLTEVPALLIVAYAVNLSCILIGLFFIWFAVTHSRVSLSLRMLEAELILNSGGVIRYNHANVENGREYKFTVLGGGGVGKSSLTIRYTTANFATQYDPTIEDGYRKQSSVDGHACLINVLDTAGQEEFSSMQDQWIREGVIYVLVYNVNSRATFDETILLREKVIRILDLDENPEIPIVLVGHRHIEDDDDNQDRVVSKEEGEQLAAAWGAYVRYVEASARENVNVDRIFEDGIRLFWSINT